MNTFKEFVAKFKNQIFYSLLIVFCGLGLYIAYTTVDHIEYVVNGTLGIAVLYLSYINSGLSKKSVNESSGFHVEFPRDLKYVILGFINTIVMFWAATRVLYMIWYFIGLFRK